MKNKIWIAIFAAAAVLCAVSSYFLLSSGAPAQRAEITSQGKVIRIIDLSVDQEFTVTTADGGHNVVTVQDGKIAVTEANCPDQYCMDRGFCHSGAQIVCLPNRLVIRFLGEQEIDGVVG